MAIKLGEIFVSLGLSTASFTKGLNDAKKLAFGNAKEIERSFQIMGKAALAAGTAIGTALLAMTKSGIDLAAQFHDLAQSTGVAVETLSGFAGLAKTSGLDVTTFAANLGRLSKHMAQAASGSKEQAAAFKSIGVSVKDATGSLRPIEDVLLDVADRFAGMSDGAAKTALAMQLFGKAGMEMIPFLNEGSEGLKRFNDEARRTGRIVSGETAAAADKFKDSLDILGDTIRFVGVGIASEILPNLSKMSGGLLAASGNAQEFGRTLGGIFSHVSIELGEMGLEFEIAMAKMARGLVLLAASAPVLGIFAGGPLRKQAQELQDFIGGLQVQLDLIHQEARAEALPSHGTARKAGGLQIVDEQTAAAAKKHAEAIQSILDKLREQIATLGQGAGALEVYRAKQEGASAAVLANIDSLGRQLEFLKATQALFAKTAEGAAAHQKALSEILGTDALSRAMAEIQQFEAEVIPGLGPSPEMLAAWDALTQKLENVGIIGGQSFVKIDSRMEEMRLALSELDDDMGSLGDHTRAFGEHAINSFAFAIAQGRSLHEVFKGLLQDLLAMVLRMMLLRTIGSIFGGLFGGGGGGGGGINIGASNFPSFGNAASGGSFAHGGMPPVGRFSMVGEHGPEPFLPLVPGLILPHSALAGRAGGAGDQIIQIDARGADFGTVAKISALMSRAHSRELLRIMQDRQLRTA